MDLITAKCPDCGADLKIPEGSLNVTCEYCGANVLVTDVLGSTAVVQNCMTLAYAAMQGENYDDAFNQFNKALEHGSNNYNAWFGKAICAGMLSRNTNVRFDEMVVLFENAFKNAPADKQGVLRRSAASEIVKAVRNSTGRINAADQLLALTNEPGQFNLNLSSLIGGSNNMKNEAFRALNKAREYDPMNNDVIKLQSQLGQTVQITSSEPLIIEPPPVSTMPVQPQVQTQVYGRKKGGCAAVFIVSILLVVGAACLILFLNKGTNTTNNKNDTQYRSSYTYSMVKMNEIKGTLYVTIYTDATVDNDFNEINNKVIKDYSDKSKPMIVNFYSNKSAGDKNGAVQSNHDDDWIIKNASSISLKATSEFDPGTYGKKLYKYSGGKVVNIEAK